MRSDCKQIGKQVSKIGRKRYRKLVEKILIKEIENMDIKTW